MPKTLHHLKLAAYLLRVGMPLLALLPGMLTLAQNPRDYAITLPIVSYDADGDFAIVRFSVFNQGGDAAEPTLINIVDNDSGRVETSMGLPALISGGEHSVDVRLPLSRLAAGDIFLRVEAGIDQFEVAGSPVARDNVQLFRIDASEAPSPYDVVIPLLDIGLRVNQDGIRVNDSRLSWAQLALVAAALLALLVLLFCLRLARGLIWRRPPSFEVWQPPYAYNAWHDPESPAGRRQSWQYHAASSIIQTPCAPEQAAVIKRLVDDEGRTFGAWTIVAMRCEQYDVYGRVNASSALISRDVIHGLNELAPGAAVMPSAQLEAALLPFARKISRSALRSIEKQNRSLRLALDISFEGLAGEARIIFELHQCRDGAWQLVDQWEPELGVIGSRVPEQFTLTLNGMLPGENYAEFKRRLPDEIAAVLASVLGPQRANAPEADPYDTSPGKVT